MYCEVTTCQALHLCSLGVNCVLSDSYLPDLTLHVAVFGDGAFKEVINVKSGPKDGALIQ